MTFTRVTAAEDVDIADWCTWASAQAWRNKRNAVEIEVEYNSRLVRVHVRAQAQHVHGQSRWVALHFRRAATAGEDTRAVAQGYMRLVTALMGVDKKEVVYLELKRK